MGNYFMGQMDYLYFIYGLAFILLGVVSYFLSKDVRQRLPWIWLALFGFSHGVHEWLDLLDLVWPETLWVKAGRWVLLFVSFLFLAEFGRLGLVRQRGRGPGRWILGVLALLGCLGALSSWNGLGATTRYTLGLLGSLSVSLALWGEVRRKDLPGRAWLTAGGIGFFLYALATGLLGPSADFFPASTVNYQTFANPTGLPVLLPRAFLAVVITAMSLGYLRASWPEEYPGSRSHRTRYLGGLGIALTVILTAAWVLTQFLGDLAQEQVRKDTLSRVNLIIQRLTFELEESEATAKAMSGAPWLGPVLESKSPQTLAQANSVLDRYQMRFGASPAFLLDRIGTTIASSNRDASDSFVGHNYAFRPYFQQAIKGLPGHCFALGLTSKKRGFFAGYPVHNPAGIIVGVAVTKNPLSLFQDGLRKSDPAFLINPEGMIFLSSRPSLESHSLWPVRSLDKVEQAQFGVDQVKPVFPRLLTNGAEVKIEGKIYLFYRQYIHTSAAPGWSLVLLTPNHLVVFYRLLGIAAAFIFVMFTLLAAGSNLSIREGANRTIASEARFRAMFDAAPEAVFVFDTTTRKMVEANPFMAHWLGYIPEELLNLEIDQLLAPEFAGVQCVGDLKPVSSLRFRQKDGSPVDVECTSAKISYGGRERQLVFVRDITERNRAEEALRESEARFRSLFENMTEGVALHEVIYNEQGTAVDYRIVSTNPAFENHTGRKPEQIRGQLASLAYGTGTAPYLETYAQVAHSGQPCAFETFFPPMQRHFHISVTSPKQGQFVTVFEDITEHKRLEEALRNNEAFLTDIFNCIQDGLSVLDPDLNIIRVNPAMEKFGYPQPMVGRKCYEVYHDQSQPCEDCPAQETLLTGKASRRMRHPANSSERFIELLTYPLKDRTTGQIQAVIEYVRDITEHKHAEEEGLRFSKLESLSTLAGGIAHDFNNILTAIMGNISLARLDFQKQEFSRARLNEAERACLQAQALARQLLTFAKGGAPVKELVSFEKLITESASFASTGSQVGCEFGWPENLWAVEADPGQIGQVFQNLAINAIQAMPAGGTIKIRGENLVVKKESDLPLDAGKYVKVSIQDQGIGIPGNYLPKIFDPYFTTKQMGSGLGLATVYSIVKKHRGHIAVESIMGRGTTFHIYLPAVDREVAESLQEDMEVLSGQGKILVMDDEAILRDLLEKMLGRLGYQAMFARDGEEAVELFLQARESGERFDALILDLTVPGGMGGKAALEKLLKIDPQVKAVVSSGYSDDPIIADYQKHGFSGVIAKPYKISELSKVLNKVISGRDNS